MRHLLNYKIVQLVKTNKKSKSIIARYNIKKLSNLKKVHIFAEGLRKIGFISTK